MRLLLTKPSTQIQEECGCRSDKDKEDNGRATPFLVAEQKGHVEIVKLLREAGADPDKSKRLMAPKLAREKEDEAAQRQNGRSPWTRIAGQPGSVKRDFANGVMSLSAGWATIGSSEALVNSGVLYYEIAIIKMMGQNAGPQQLGFSLKDGVAAVDGVVFNGVGDRKCAWNDGQHPWPQLHVEERGCYRPGGQHGRRHICHVDQRRLDRRGTWSCVRERGD